MHQQIAVGVGDGVGKLQKQVQARLDGQAAHGFVDGHTRNKFHDEIGQAVVAGTGVEQARDVRMAQAREGLTLLRKTPQHRRAVHAAFEQFDGGAAFEAAVGAARFKHIAHAASAHGADDLPGPKTLAFTRWVGDLGRVVRENLQRCRGAQKRVVACRVGVVL